MRRLYAAFSPLAAARHFRADAAEAVYRVTTRPARGVSLLGVFGRLRYAADVGRLLVPAVAVSVVVQLAANAVVGGALAQLLGGGGGGGEVAAAAAAAATTAVASATPTGGPSLWAPPTTWAAALEGLGVAAGLVANAWLAGTALRFLNTLVTERDEVLYGSLRGSVAAVAPEWPGGGGGWRSGGGWGAGGSDGCAPSWYVLFVSVVRGGVCERVVRLGAGSGAGETGAGSGYSVLPGRWGEACVRKATARAVLGAASKRPPVLVCG